MFAHDQTQADTQAQSQTVSAHCTDCSDTHPLGDRRMEHTTTTCPRCGSTSYETRCSSETPVKPEDHRIADAIRDADGIGDATRENIVSTFGYYVEFEAATLAELREIDGVGKITAKRISNCH